MTWVWVTLLVLLWAGSGIVGVVLLLNRRGHRESSWYILGAILGPLFVPIAAERARRHSDVLERHVESTSSGESPHARPCVLVGVDGSPESDQAVRDAARLVAPTAGRILLVTVVDADSAEYPDDRALVRARSLVERNTADLAAGAAVVETDILSGEPAQALLEFAAAEDADLIVVGRRGKGLSHAVLGSVAEHIGERARGPVLLGSPVSREASSP